MYSIHCIVCDSQTDRQARREISERYIRYRQNDLSIGESRKDKDIVSHTDKPTGVKALNRETETRGNELKFERKEVYLSLISPKPMPRVANLICFHLAQENKPSSTEIWEAARSIQSTNQIMGGRREGEGERERKKERESEKERESGKEGK